MDMNTQQQPGQSQEPDLSQMPDDTPIQVGDQVMTIGQYKEAQKEELHRVFQGFSSMRDRWVAYRAQSGVESRWRRAMAMYNGQDADGLDSSLMNTLKTGPAPRGKTTPRSRVTVNIVRPKVDQAVARMCEILLPVDDQNWEVRPTPVPSMVNKLVGDMRPTVDPESGEETGLTADDEAQAVIAEAREKAEAMQDAIADTLTECGFNAECRKGIHDGVLLGTMVMEGPYPSKSISKAWVNGPDGKPSMQISSTTVPSSRRRDPWDIWFDPACGNDHQRGAGYWSKQNITRKELRNLVGLPGYDAETIREVLRTAPSRLFVAEGRVTYQPAYEDSYEMWTYHGEVEPSQIEMLASRGGHLAEEVTFAMCVMINDRIIAVAKSWVIDGTLPVDVWNWRESDGMPQGYGLADELEHQQRVVNSTWRMVMDNGRASLGSQVVMKKRLIAPADGDHTLGGGLKIWEAADDVEDVTKAFAVFDFPSHLSELLAIADKALSFSDMETSMPQLLNGNQGTGPTPETVGGMVMLYNNANTVLRYRVKKYDDRITRPHIGRHYDFKMANDPRQEIKGDMEVDARGASSLIERDIQNQATLNLSQITTNPRYADLMEPAEELKAILKAFRFQPDSLMKSRQKLKQEEEARAQNPAPQDPRIEAANLNLQAKQMDIDDRKEQRNFDAQRLQADNQYRSQTLSYNQLREQAEYELQTNDMAIKRDTALLKIDTDTQLSREELTARERMNALTLDHKRQVFNAEAALRIRTGQGI